MLIHFLFSLKNISIYDCQADQGGGIYIDGFQMSFIYSDLSFYNVKAVDGAAIWILNSFSGLTFITNVYIQDSETSSSLINIDSLEMVLTNLILVRNKGRAIFINNSTFTLAGGFVSEHFCQGVDNQGCFAYIQEISVTFFSDLYFQNVFSEFIEDTFSIINTDITFTNISFRNCTTEADTILVTAFDCKIFLQDSTIKDLNNALIKITSTELIISNSLFMNISSQSSFAIIEIIDGLNFLAHSSSFLFISGKFGGAISLTGGAIEYDYNLTNVLIKDCTAWKGAGVYINGQNFNIINSSFINNTALNGGGGLYFDCSLDDNYKWVIESSNFINNTAKQGGAFHSTRYIPIYNNKCFFINNTAQYGNDFSGTPLQMTLEVENNLLNCDLNASNCYLRNNAITSGQTMPPLIISILDYYGQKMTLLNGLGFLDLITQPIEIPTTIEKTFDFLNISENSALIRNTAVFTGVKTQILLNGSFNFSEVVIQSKPPSNVWIKVKSDLIPIYFSDLIPNNSYFNWKDNNTGEYYFLFKMYIRECISGEVSFNNGTECNVCPKGKYSFFATDLDCKTCPITAECDGGNLFSLNKGFWRPYNNSDDVYTCNLLTESCLGGVNSECSNGYSGIMCSSCLFNEKQKYFKKAVFFCEECTNVWIYILIIVIVSFFIFGFIVFLITRKGANIENYVLIKIITNHIQTISFLSNVKIEFPKFLQGFINAQAPITSMDSFVFTIDCFKDSLSLSIYEMKLILSIVIMFGVVFVVILGFILIGYRKKQRKMNIIFNIINALVIIFSFFQPPFINFYIQNLSCDTVNNQQYMTYNLEQECWNKSHLTYSLIITIPFLLFWMVFFPLIFLIYMRKHRNNLDDTIVKQITIYFQAGYEKRVYYWEFVQMIRKFSVILLITFLRNNPQSVIYILIPVIAFFFILQIGNMPYVKNNLQYNFLEILSLNACFITYYSAAFYFKVISKALKTFFLIVILTANGVFFFFWIQKYLLVLKGRIKNILTNFRYSKNGKSLFSSKIRPLTRKRTFTDPKKMSK